MGTIQTTLFVLALSLLFTVHVLIRREDVQELNILGPNDLPKINPLGCFKSKGIFEVEAAICVKKGDMFVSNAIVKEGAWEEENVRNLMKAVSLYKNAVFMRDPTLVCTPSWLPPWRITWHISGLVW